MKICLNFCSFHSSVSSNEKVLKCMRPWRHHVSISVGTDKNLLLSSIQVNVDCSFFYSEDKSQLLVCFMSSKKRTREQSLVDVPFCSEVIALALLTWRLSSAMMLVLCQHAKVVNSIKQQQRQGRWEPDRLCCHSAKMFHSYMKHMVQVRGWLRSSTEATTVNCNTFLCLFN